MKIKFHDIATGKIEERDMNAKELALHKTFAAEAEAYANAENKAQEAAQIRKQIILDRLGITGDEFNALLS